MNLGEHDYRTFLKRMRTVVMGRGTYDFIAGEPSPWAYEDKRVIVVTSRRSTTRGVHWKPNAVSMH